MKNLAIFLSLLIATYAAPTGDLTALATDKPDCPMICPFIFMPLCGTDGRTYSNDCDLKVSNCLKKTTVTALHSGTCSEESGNGLLLS